MAKRKQACVEISLDTIYSQLNNLRTENQQQHDEIKEMLTDQVAKTKVCETKIGNLEGQTKSIFAGFVTIIISGITIFLFGK